MTVSRKTLAVFGTRPEAIKMAPLVKALQEDRRIDCRIAVTAQHREMLDQVLRLFKIKPDYDLDIMQAGQSLYDITVRALQGLKEVLRKERPDLVLVHGDTSTTFVGALAAYYEQVPSAHVEAGLRSGNKYSPFPEEMNRRLAGAICDLHFAPTITAEENLLREGIRGEQIFVTGNTVIDALLRTVRDEYKFETPSLRGIDFAKHRVLVVTTHRRENLGERMHQMYMALRDIVREFPDVVLVFPVHKNPAVRSVAEEVLEGQERVLLIEPLDYEPFANLMNKSYLVLTDSGGLQEEAPALGKPVLVLRENTERPEAVCAGTVELVGTKRDRIYQAAKRLLVDEEAYRRMAGAVNPYGDGKASQRIVQALYYYWGWSGERPGRFKGASGNFQNKR
ncbi:MAG: UDP-N-acetylglucosamine 2-epimerase (non-hydrolyzing) [Peptococcaceae bacterium]|nr:UDP-N-acetylglucosamine 2-epimerase (non-hydrolyzing) [Peptococcaceae bacterium]MDH7523723.1 UDP-N-acetylglucosamine 2-epimerase (non-hydrolyzing) [Peptococcaceae bacterium]